MSEEAPKPIPEPPDPVLTPEQLETAGFFPARFRRTANSLAALYGAPVYLVGSALDSRRRARDIDVRVIVAELDWCRLFRTPFFDPQVPHYDNNPGQMLRLQENLKRSRELHATFKERIDFQIQHQAEAEVFEVCVPPRPRLRLDSAPEGFFEVGLPGSVSG